MTLTVEKLIRDKELDTRLVNICSTFNNTINIMPLNLGICLMLDYEVIDCYKDDGLIYMEISNENYHDLIRRLNEINRCND